MLIDGTHFQRQQAAGPLREQLILPLACISVRSAWIQPRPTSEQARSMSTSRNGPACLRMALRTSAAFSQPRSAIQISKDVSINPNSEMVLMNALLRPINDLVSISFAFSGCK